MKLFDVTQMRTLRGATLQGLALGFKLAMLYWLVSAVLVILRTSLHILASLGWAEGLLMTLLANAVSILAGTLLIGLILGLVAAPFSLAVVLLLRALLPRLGGRPPLAALAGVVLSGALVLLLSLLFRQALGSHFGAMWPNGYLFWLGLPGMIFMAASGYLGWQLGS
jgi:hypothetical protein